MKILLINDNPVVNKLVTLSAQKTSDELEAVEVIEDISQNSYDLVVIDDTLYSDALMNELNAKTKYKKSLFICSKDAPIREEFTQILKKPFLPTDLVEMFSTLGTQMQEMDVPIPLEESSSESSEVMDLDDNFDELESLEPEDDAQDFNIDLDLGELDELEDDDVENFSLDESEDEETLHEVDTELLDGVLDDEVDEVNEETIDAHENVSDVDALDDVLDDSLDDLDDDLDASLADLDFDDEEVESSLGELDLDDLETDEELGSVLDEDDLNEVNEIMDDINEVNESSDDILANESSDDTTEAGSEENELEELSPSIDSDLDNSTLDDLELEPDSDLEDLELDSDLEDPDAIENIEELIESAEEELTQEDLNAEVDLDEYADLTSNEIKLALGEALDDTIEATSEENELEEVNEINDDILDDSAEENGLEESNPSTDSDQDEQSLPKPTQITPTHDGIEALKKLLKALENEDVAASMQGMKININFELGDK